MTKNRLPFLVPNAHLKRERLLRGWTQADLAGHLETDGYTVYRWESGRTRPSPYFSKKLCDLFGKSALELGLVPAHLLSPLPVTVRSESAFYWFVPHLRNPFFTGREKILETLYAVLKPERTVTQAQTYALHGLGGMGKTQIALEYAYRYAQEYRAVFWIEAETSASIVASLVQVAEHLQLPEWAEAEQSRVIADVQHWFATQSKWLLIWDNVEEPDLLYRFLPLVRQGAILITTRSQALGTLAQSLALEPLAREEGMLLALRRAKVLEGDSSKEQMDLLAQRLSSEYTAAEQLVTRMGGLPLAIDQAGAYIEETQCSIDEYLKRLEQHSAQLLGRRGNPGNDHPQSVITTFFLAYIQVKRQNPLAAEILSLAAFLAPDAIPEEVLTVNQSLPADPLEVDQAFAVLHSFSLVQRQRETQTFSLHCLVQAALLGRMSEQEQAKLQQRVLSILNTVFPSATYNNWKQCERFLPHILACAKTVPESPQNQLLAEVQRKAAAYLREREQYGQAEPLY